MIQISLDPALDEFITRQVKSGKFPSASEAIIDAVRLAKEIEEDSSPELEALRREIQIGIDELERGEGKPWDYEAFKRRMHSQVESLRK